MKIKTFIINLSERTDRRKSVESQFQSREEFTVEFVNAFRHEVGAVGLNQTLFYIFTELVKPEDDYILVCEDDHFFTDDYNQEALFRSIETAKRLNADVLLGGVSWFSFAVQVTNSLFWIDKFNGLQCTVFFRTFFDRLIDCFRNTKGNADIKISNLSTGIYLMYPFVSIQKEFGYSDVTSKNAIEGYVEGIFKHSLNRLGNLVQVNKYYNRKFRLDEEK
ncbi:hypothetical protein RYH73_13080 [Olivibacter sp. CPCC 100613]|uniref:hypothetical protein n=1 Tax=Olivibacter sp. CPCC 100613 TaxID=3079931 RepID=UPI002FF8704D